MSLAKGVAFFRDADWLTAGRVRGYAVLLGIACLALLANSFLKAMQPAGSDFLAFWGAGVVTAAGEPALAYDLAVQEQVQTGTGAQGWFAFVNPPPFLFAVAPFGLLPFPAAWIAWVIITYALWCWAGICAFPRLWPLVVIYPGALLAAGHAQNGLLTGALLIAGVHLVARRPLWSGAAIGALVIKPHLALLLPFWLASGGRWRPFVAAAVTVLALLALSWAVFGSATMSAYTGSWEASATLMERGREEFLLRMTTFYSQIRLLAGEGAGRVAAILSGLFALAAAVLSWRRLGRDPRASGAAVLAASALATPYLFNYDLPFLVFPTLWLIERGRRHGFRPWEKSVLLLLYFAPYATRAAALPLGVNLMPVAAAVLLWLIWTSPAPGRAGNEPGT